MSNKRDAFKPIVFTAEMRGTQQQADFYILMSVLNTFCFHTEAIDFKIHNDPKNELYHEIDFYSSITLAN